MENVLVIIKNHIFSQATMIRADARAAARSLIDSAFFFFFNPYGPEALIEC